MHTMLRRQTAAAVGVCAAGVALPATVLLVVGRHESMPGSGVHFWGVGFGAILATVAALALTIVGWRRNDARTVLVGTAFSVMAALLALHGLATPGVIMGYEGGLGAFTGGATLLLGAAVLALAALPTVSEPQSVNRLVVLQVILIVAIAILGAVGMLVPSVVPDVPEAGGALALGLLAVGLLLYAFLGVRAINTYLLTRRLSDLLVVLGLSFLATALVAALVLDYMQLGWWLGHGFELLGIALVGITVAVDLSRAQPSRSLTGGPRAGELVQAEQAFLGARVRALTLRLAEKDEYTEGHTRRVALRAVLVGEELGLSANRIRSLATGGLLHDIGKLSVPDEILKKPGALDQDEFAVIKRHPEWGHKLLGELGGFSDLVRRLVLDHHERLDGAGYPHGRTALDLDLETRILTVCDVYDALLSVRVYRDAWTHDKAIGLLREQTGSAFDPGCVAALERVLARDALVLGVAV